MNNPVAKIFNPLDISCPYLNAEFFRNSSQSIVDVRRNPSSNVMIPSSTKVMNQNLSLPLFSTSYDVSSKAQDSI